MKTFWQQRCPEEVRNVISLFVKCGLAFLFGFLFIPLLFVGGLQ